MPSPLITVLLPPFVKVADVKPFNSFAKRNFNVSEPSETTPMLSSVANLLSSEIPPLTFTWLLSFFLITLPVSPPYIIPSFRFATSSFVPSGFWYTMRVVVVPAAPSTPGLPSRVTEIFVVTPSLPLMPILPSLPSLPVAVIVSVLRSLPSFTSMVLSPFASWEILVMMLELSPFTDTLDPNLFVFSPPVLASNFKPSLITLSNLDLDATSLILTVSLLPAWFLSSTVKSISPLESTV